MLMTLQCTATSSITITGMVLPIAPALAGTATMNKFLRCVRYFFLFSVRTNQCQDRALSRAEVNLVISVKTGFYLGPWASVMQRPEKGVRWLKSG